MQERSDVLELWWGKNKPSSGFHHWLQPWQEMWWNAQQCRIAVVQLREDEIRHKRLENGSRHWSMDGPQMTQYRVASRYGFRNVRPSRIRDIPHPSRLQVWGNVVSSPAWYGTNPRPKTSFGVFRVWKNASDSDKFDIFDIFAAHINAHSHSQLLNIRLHVYICPYYTAKTVVNFFHTALGA